MINERDWSLTCIVDYIIQTNLVYRYRWNKRCNRRIYIFENHLHRPLEHWIMYYMIILRLQEIKESSVSICQQQTVGFRDLDWFWCWHMPNIKMDWDKKWSQHTFRWEIEIFSERLLRTNILDNRINIKYQYLLEWLKTRRAMLPSMNLVHSNIEDMTHRSIVILWYWSSDNKIRVTDEYETSSTSRI
jgi:hypothetical protein